MHMFIVGLISGFAMTVSGVAVTAWWYRFRVHHSLPAQNSAEVHRAAEVLGHLLDLANRVAVDVNEHNSQVEGINDELTSTETHESAVIVDVVARLIQTNQHMQEKLASTEDKLREQAQQIEAHAAEARTDALTLLANRRAFDDELARRIAEFRRHGRIFSLIMADVDRFKLFNDTFGHQAGDQVLQEVARLIRRKMRSMDLVARYGGEEFAVILPGIGLQDVHKAAQRVREAVERCRIPRTDKELNVTLSLGVAGVLTDDDGTTLLKRTDMALYAAKGGGRNCVYAHDGTTVRRIDIDNECVLPAVDVPPLSGSATCELRLGGETGRSEDAAAVQARSNSASDVKPDVGLSLPSRTTFCSQVRARMAEWKRSGPAFSVILLAVNPCESCGEPGEQPTREVAVQAATAFLAATVRDMDMVGDYAPDCYALMLPSASLADAIRVAERLRIGLAEGSAAESRNQLRMTVSVGVVQVADDGDYIYLLKRAEAALDAARCGGGNRTYCHDGERCAPVTAILETMGYLV